MSDRFDLQEKSHRYSSVSFRSPQKRSIGLRKSSFRPLFQERSHYPVVLPFPSPQKVPSVCVCKLLVPCSNEIPDFSPQQILHNMILTRFSSPPRKFHGPVEFSILVPKRPMIRLSLAFRLPQEKSHSPIRSCFKSPQDPQKSPID